MRRTKRLAALALCAVMAFMLAACAGKSNSEAGEGSYTVDTVSITYVKSPLNVPSIVEKQQHLFEKAYEEMGLKFAYSDLTSGSDQTAALASGDIQILNAVGGTSVLLSAANGADIKIISMYSTSPEAFCLYSADDSISSPEDLRGKTIVGPKGTNLHELLTAYLATAGMTLDDVSFLNMQIPEARAALEGGSADCALLAGPNAYNAGKAGFHLVTTGKGLIAATIMTATTQEFYDNNKAIVDRFIEIQEEILEFIRNNEEEALKMTAVETELPEEAVQDMYQLYNFHSEITEEDLAALQNTEEFMLESGLIENEVDVSSLVLERN